MSQDRAGTNKGLISFQGRPLVRHVIDRLVPQVHCLILNTPPGPAWNGFGYERIADQLGHPEHPIGPLAGIHAGLLAIHTEWVICVPCDTPFLPTNLVSRLVAAQQDSGAMSVSVRCGPRLHPILCLLHKSLTRDLEKFIDGGGRSVENWLRTIPAYWCDFNDADAFVNLNTRAELEAMERR